MGIILGDDVRVVVQGVTGSQGRFHTALMASYGTKIVAGITPGKGGEQVHDIPVYNTVSEAVSIHGANASIIFVPAAFAQHAVLEAIDAGIETVVVITEMIPKKDTIQFLATARERGVAIIGPNTPGVISPGRRTHLGVMPAYAFQPGPVGMVSRSGTLTYEIAWYISKAGLGQSTCLGLGGDPIVGLDFIQVLELQ